MTWVTLKLRTTTLYTSNLETVKEGTVNLYTWVKVKQQQQQQQLKTYPINMIENVLEPCHEAVG